MSKSLLFFFLLVFFGQNKFYYLFYSEKSTMKCRQHLNRYIIHIFSTRKGNKNHFFFYYNACRSKEQTLHTMRCIYTTKPFTASCVGFEKWNIVGFSFIAIVKTLKSEKLNIDAFSHPVSLAVLKLTLAVFLPSLSGICQKSLFWLIKLTLYWTKNKR